MIKTDKKKKDEHKKLKIIPGIPLFDDPVNRIGDIPTDVLGSYSGLPIDGGMPVQDADDL